MWIESYETMAVEGFMMEARVQRSAPDEVHTVTVVEKPGLDAEGSDQWLWSVESVYGQLVAEGSSPSEDEAKSEALTAARADGGSNDPEEFEQALQSTAERTDDPWMAVMPRLEELDAKAWDGLTEEEAAERERLQNDAVEMGFRLPSVYQRGVDLGHDGYEASLDEMREEFTEGVMERMEAFKEANPDVDLGRMFSQAAVEWQSKEGPGGWSTYRATINGHDMVVEPRENGYYWLVKDLGRSSGNWGGATIEPVGTSDTSEEAKEMAVVYAGGDRTAAVASEDYPMLSEVLEERLPLEHNAGRFPGDDEPEGEGDIQPLGLKDLTEPGEDEQDLDPFLSSMVSDSVAAIHGYVTSRHSDADKAYSAYSLLTADERLSKTQRGSKAIHIYETAVR